MEIIIFTWLSALTILVVLLVIFFSYCMNKLNGILQTHRVCIDSMAKAVLPATPVTEGAGDATVQTAEQKLDAAKKEGKRIKRNAKAREAYAAKKKRVVKPPAKKSSIKKSEIKKAVNKVAEK